MMMIGGDDYKICYKISLILNTDGRENFDRVRGRKWDLKVECTLKCLPSKEGFKLQFFEYLYSESKVKINIKST